jgi:hypothetical protein
MSAIVSIDYQDDLMIPGISPFEASSLKQMRQMSKSRIYPRLRPQRQQRLTSLVEYFGLAFDLNDLAICALVAI